MSTEIQAPDPATLEALSNINKHAKRYADLASKNYAHRKNAASRINSLKKNALYRTTEAGLKEVLRHTEPDAVELHELNGEDYWCLWFDSWSFHVPKDRTEYGPWERLPELLQETDPDGESDELDDFEESLEKKHSDQSVKASLLHLEAVGINANDHLEQTFVNYGPKRYFAGWSYLGDDGDRMDATPTDS